MHQQFPGRACRLLALLVPCLLSAGCTTVDDFRAMTPAQYAAKTCSEVDEVSSLRDRLSDAGSRLERIRGNVERGYALHEDCRTVSVADGTTTRCRQEGSRTVCETVPRWREVERCRSIPVPIDMTAERQKLAGAEADVRRLREELRELYSGCVEAVGRMSPDDAYRVWEDGHAPVLLMR